MALLTAREYLALSETTCPKCSSTDLDFSNIEVEGHEAWQRVSCVCDFTFTKEYVMVGYGYEEEDVVPYQNVRDHVLMLTKAERKLIHQSLRFSGDFGENASWQRLLKETQ